ILRGVRQQQDEPGRFSICSRQAAVVRLKSHPPQGDIQSIEGPEKNDKLYPGEEDTDSSVILDVK
ncbi:hypothetical protein AAGN07_28330, partial [Klebsiella pneumoniae]|uniref:hypothetical protein n=1 Tax=Klebsiella pneumoniae TaxID=573 RepID=UPI000F44D713